MAIAPRISGSTCTAFTAEPAINPIGRLLTQVAGERDRDAGAPRSRRGRRIRARLQRCRESWHDTGVLQSLYQYEQPGDQRQHAP